MKITGGQARGIRLQVPPGDRTRPTTDQARESIFSSLQNLIPGAAVVDLFSGSGALGLEAASRGAAEVCCVEKHPAAVNAIRENCRRVRKAGADCPVQAAASDVFRWLSRAAAKSADMIFADPPYDLLAEQSELERLLGAIADADCLRPEGWLVLETRARAEWTEPAGWTLVRSRRFGGSEISYWQLSGVRR